MSLRRRAALLIVAGCFVSSRTALAAEPPSVDEEEDDPNAAITDEALGPRGNLRTRAESVSFDAREKTLELSGNVRIDSPPFHLRAQRIRLTRTRLGIDVEGKGRLAFCPCLGTPFAVEFDKAIVAPPGDLVLRNPTLEVYGVPVLWLPWFWLRSDEKPGVLPPDLAYRGTDGMFVGEGVHIPWKSRGKRHSLDLRAGAYLVRGFATEAVLRTPVSHAKIRFDRLERQTSDDGLFVDARGATQDHEISVAWDADVLRGRRAVVATTDLDTAAKPFDRASVEGALRSGPFTVATAMRAVTRRGDGLEIVDVAGPVTTVRASGAASAGIAYDVTLEGGALRAAGRGGVVSDTISFARAEAGAIAGVNAGPIATSVSLRGAGDVAAEGRRDGSDRALSARVHVGVPLARGYASDEERDPWVHAIEPFVEAAILHARGDTLLGTAPGRALAVIDGTSPVATAGVTSTLGRWAKRTSLDALLAAGAAYGSVDVASRVRPLVRGRLSASLDWFGASAEGAHVRGDDRPEDGTAIVGRVRVGRASGLRVLANVAARDGLDPVLARLLTDAPLEAPAGFLVREGTTGGAGVVVPWSRVVATSAGADADATKGELVAARGAVELRDTCGCITLRVNGSHRIGRPGVDVWLVIDFAVQ